MNGTTRVSVYLWTFLCVCLWWRVVVLEFAFVCLWVSICMQNKEYVLVFEGEDKRAISIFCVCACVCSSMWIQTQSDWLLFFRRSGWGRCVTSAFSLLLGYLAQSQCWCAWVCVVMMLVPKTKPAAVFTGSHTNPFICCHLRPLPFLLRLFLYTFR